MQKSLNNNVKQLAISEIKPSQKINKYKGPFCLSCTSTKDPNVLVNDLIYCMEKLKIKYIRVSPYQFNCQKLNIRFEIEVMQLDEIEGLQIIRFKKITGEMAQYKEIGVKIITLINI